MANEDAGGSSPKKKGQEAPSSSYDPEGAPGDTSTQS
jgi:hypothetical protein